MSELPFVSIIIPTHNRRLDVLDTIEACKDSVGIRYDIVVVDDCSTDGTSEAIKERYPDIKLIRHEKNKNACGSRNTGLRNINDNASYILLLDSDVIMESNSIINLVDAIKDKKEYGCATGKVLFSQRPDYIQWAGSAVGLVTGLNYAHSGVDGPEFSKEKQVQITGAVFLMKREVLEKVGLYDELYKIRYDDSDYSLRIGKAGYKSLFVPDSRFYHRYPVLSGKDEARRWFKDAYLSARNKIIFMRKYSRCFWCFLLFYPVYLAIYTIKPMIYGQPKAILDFYRGTIDGIRWAIEND